MIRVISVKVWICTTCGALGDDSNRCGCISLSKIPRQQLAGTQRIEEIRHRISRKLTRKILES